MIRRDPEFTVTAQVVGSDVLDMPAGRFSGFKIRLQYAGLRPNDLVHVWYGRAGYLQLAAHTELDATDNQGTIVGRVMVDDLEQLVDLSLVPPAHGSPLP